jgi:hypothetical protein
MMHLKNLRGWLKMLSNNLSALLIGPTDKTKIFRFGSIRKEDYEPFREGANQFRKQKEDFARLQEHSARDLKIAKSYASQRDAAEKRGDSTAARQFDDRIAELASSYIHRMSLSN